MLREFPGNWVMVEVREYRLRGLFPLMIAEVKGKLSGSRQEMASMPENC